MYIENINDVTFWGANIPNEVERIAKKLEKDCTNGMTNTELKAYRLGVDNAISFTQQLLNDLRADANVGENAIVFYNPTVDGIEEFLAEELLPLADCEIEE